MSDLISVTRDSRADRPGTTPVEEPETYTTITTDPGIGQERDTTDPLPEPMSTLVGRGYQDYQKLISFEMGHQERGSKKPEQYAKSPYKDNSGGSRIQE